MSEQIVMNTIFNGFTTGNPITDIALRTLILTAITAVMNWFTTKLNLINMYNNLRNYLFKQQKYPEIIMEAESVDIMMGGKKVNSKMNYSKGFLAVLHYINTHQELNIRVFKETTAFNQTRDKDTYFSGRDERDEIDRLKKLNDKYYIPYTNDEFMLEPSIELMCHININMVKNIKNTDEISGKESNTDKNIHQIQLYIKKGTMCDIHTFINKCINNHEKYQESQLNDEQFFFNFRQCVDIDGTIQAEWEEIKFTTNKTFDHVFFDKKDKLMDQIDFFMKNPEWYKKHGLPYHLGLLLYGTPGCGKTSTIKVIAQRIGYSIIVINLNRIKSSRELESIFYNQIINKKVIPNNNRIYVFEDIDCLSSVVLDRSEVNSEASSINGDDNADNSIMKLASAIIGAQKGEVSPIFKEDSDKLNLSCLLNLLDGIIETPGRIVIMTSNYPERLDKALIRAGRIDISIELKKASKKIIIEILSNFFEISVDTIQTTYESLLSQINEYKYSPAEVCNYCVMNKTSIEDCLIILIN